jgi:hypothetical protein
MKRRGVILGFMAALGASAPVVAVAQPKPSSKAGAPAADEIVLKNGGVIRGTVVANDPGKETVILVTGTKQPRHVLWAQIKQVKLREETAPTAAPPPPPKETVHVDGMTRLHIAADTPEVNLHRMSTVKANVPFFGPVDVRKGLPVCPAPCDKIVDGSDGELFYFGGEGLMPSQQFQLRGLGPDAKATVTGGSVHKYNGGLALTIIGSTAVLSGLAFIVCTAIGGCADDNGNFVPLSHGWYAAGGVTAAVGLGVLAGGIVLLMQGKTRYAFGQSPVTSRGLMLRF